MAGSGNHEQAIRNGLRLTVAALLVGSLLVTAIPAATAGHTADSDNEYEETVFPIGLWSVSSVSCTIFHNYDGSWDYYADGGSWLEADEYAPDVFFDWWVYAKTIVDVKDVDEKEGTSLPPYEHQADSSQSATYDHQKYTSISASARAHQEDARTGGLLISANTDARAGCSV